MSINNNLESFLKYIILAILVYIPIFGYLDILPIRIWDEARLALNASEMLKNGNYLVTHYLGNPDMWNTKPPFMIWMQVGFMKLIGVSETSVRLPSATAAFFTLILLLLLAQRYLKNTWIGFIMVLVLITSSGFISIHGTRTGDYDALLTFFTTLSGLSFFAYVENQNQKYLYIFFIALTLGVLTKSIAGLLFLPALVIYALYRRQIIPILKNKHFYFGLFSFLLVTIGYYFLRELYNPGYIEAVQKNELGGRFLTVIEKHGSGFWYYYNNFIDFQYKDWYLLVPVGMVLGSFYKNKQLRNITIFSNLMIIVFFIVISTAKTKLDWYDLPMYPFLAILVSIPICLVFDWLSESEWIRTKLFKNITPFLFLFLIFIFPYARIIGKTYLPDELPKDKEFYQLESYLRGAIKGHQNLNGNFLLYSGYDAQNQFYLNILRDKGIEIYTKNWRNLDIGDEVIVSQDKLRRYLKNHYEIELLQKINIIEKFRINGKKN